MQWELVSLLVKSWGEGFGLVHEAPLPPSLFLVGDRKQSIYRFRDADVGPMLVHVVNSDGYIVVERTADETADLEAVAREMVRAATIEFDPEAAKAVWARERGG